MKIKIKVTKDVLRRSMMCNTDPNDPNPNVGRNCAIGIAACELFPNGWAGYDTFLFNSNDLETYADFPLSATEFIKQFDLLKHAPELRLSLPEISFDIEVPDRVIEAIGITEATEILAQSKTMELVS